MKFIVNAALMLKLSFRHFSKNKAQLLLSLLGLVTAWLCFLSIGVLLQHELAFDEFHEKHSRIYRVTYNENAGKIPGTRHLATVGPPLAPALKANIPAVEDAARLRYSPDWTVEFGEHRFYEPGVWYVDSSFFALFDFPVVQGIEEHFFDLPNSVVITDAIASKYFQEKNPIGQSLEMNGELWEVTGVVSVPSQSHFQFDFLLPFEKFTVPYGYPVNLDTWGWISFHTYVLLREGVPPHDVESQLPDFVKTHWSADRADRFKLELQPLDEIYLGDVAHEQILSGSKSSLLLLSIAGCFILVIASFNFANLFTVVSLSRAKQFGVQKVLGASRSQLSLSVLADAVLFMVLSLTLALALLPSFTALLPWKLALPQLDNRSLWKSIGIIALLATVIGFTVGIYPSQMLAKHDFNKLLKGAFKLSKSGLVIRRMMLTAQFVVSLALMSSVVILSKQLRFLESKDLGYVKDELLLLRMPGEVVPQHFVPLKHRLTQLPQVSDVSIGGGRMDGDTGNVPIFTPSGEDTGIPMAIDAVSFSFFETIGVPLLAGREFTLNRQADTISGVILNESAVKLLGWTPETALNQPIRVSNIVENGEVIGVVPDFHFGSLHEAIKPLAIYYPRTRLQDIYVRFNSSDADKLIEAIGNEWKAIVPELPFEYVFLSDHLSNLYERDKSFSAMFDFFAMLAIVIACLGLYSVMSQDIFYKIKEIGVRKVFGASALSIVSLLLRSTVMTILLALAVAVPLSLMLANRWLDSFAYKIDIPTGAFVISGLILVVLAVATVSIITFRAATIPPTKLLRNE